MNYMVCTRGKHGPVFGTLEEASAYEMQYRRKTGVIMTARKITHRMEVEKISRKFSVTMDEACVKYLEEIISNLYDSDSGILKEVEYDENLAKEYREYIATQKKIMQALANRMEV